MYEIRGSYHVQHERGFETMEDALNKVTVALMFKAPHFVTEVCGDDTYFWLTDEDRLRDQCADRAIAVVCETETRNYWDLH